MNETHYTDEKLEGKETWWWANSKKSSETHWKNDKNDVLDGMVTEWYSSGKKKSTSHYKEGKENGFRKEWDKDEKLTFQENFVDGLEEIK